MRVTQILGYNPRKFWESWYRRVGFHEGASLSAHNNYEDCKAYYKCIEDFLRAYLDPYRVKENVYVCDIGAGTGHFTDFCIENVSGACVYALEICDFAVKQLETKYAGLNVVVLRGDISNFELPSMFHVILAIGLLHHIVKDEDFERALVNIRKALRDDGVLFVTSTFVDKKFWGVLRKDFRFPRGIYKKYRSWEKWEAALDRANLRAWKVHTLEVPASSRWLPNAALVLRKRGSEERQERSLKDTLSESLNCSGRSAHKRKWIKNAMFVSSDPRAHPRSRLVL